MVMTPRRRRIALLAATAVGVLALVTSPIWALDIARRISWFEVRRVEVSGTRLLAPHEVIAASGVTLGQPIFDENAAWKDDLLAHPVIADARVKRRLPHTLRISIEEKSPVALVVDGTLRFATASGEVLPIDPFAAPLDLPIVRGSLSDSAAAVTTRRILGEVARLATLDPAFLGDVSEIRPASNDSTSLVLHHRRADVIVPFGATADRIGQLRRVIADVERRFPAPANPDGPRHRIDLRFGDQVVVRPSTPPDRT